MFTPSKMKTYILIALVVTLFYPAALNALKKCPNGKPLQYSNGTEIFCGRGPAHRDCPATHECNIHPTDRFAVCCSKPEQNVCLHRKPYMEGGQIFMCGGIACIPCPRGHLCIYDGPGADMAGTCCPEAPVCRHGDPYKTTGSAGGLINFQCGGIAGIGCPRSYDCVVTATGADRFGVCCPPACPTSLIYNSCGTACPPTCKDPNPSICIKMCVAGCFCPDTAPVRHHDRCIRKDDCPSTPPVCPHGQPLKKTGPDGNMINFPCGGIAGFRCPAAYTCVITAPGADRLGVCCPPEKLVCPRGRPHIKSESGQISQCGGKMGMPCPMCYRCIPDAPGADRTGTCCPEVCPRGRPHLNPQDGQIFQCGGRMNIRCPRGFVCRSERPEVDQPGVCCPEAPVCRHGDPYKTTCAAGGLINFQCGGIAGIRCPASYDCVITAPGADRFGVCCPAAKPVCPRGNPRRILRPDGTIGNLQCGGLAGHPCPPGYKCVVTEPGADRMGICCLEEKNVCPRGEPHKHPLFGLITHCGGWIRRRCPNGYICVPGGTGTNSLGTCCPKVAKCYLPKEPGPCSCSILRWYYDERSTGCLSFIYGGCQGNLNRFSTEDECTNFCRCSLPKDPGPCKASNPVWYYDETEDICKLFIYRGCHGNGNRFATEEECKATCPVL